MKKPEEIKKALECCFYDSAQCGECPYYPTSCDRELVRDAREYIRQLEAERDAAVGELKRIGDCRTCKHDDICTFRFPNCVECEKPDCPCHTCEYRGNWQWRGVMKEDGNAKSP